MAYETVTVERDRELPGLMTVTLNRPEKLNAINVQMHDDLQQVCRELQGDHETRVVILAGSAAYTWHRFVSSMVTWLCNSAACKSPDS